MDLALIETFGSCEVFHRFQLVEANDAALLEVFAQGLQIEYEQ